MKTGFSTIGRPKKIGSLIWKICVGSDRRLTLPKAGVSRVPQQQRQRDRRAGAADVDERREESVSGHVGQRLAGRIASTFAARYCRKIGATTASTALSPLIPTDHSR